MKNIFKFIKREKALILLGIAFLYFAITLIFGFFGLVKVKMSKKVEFKDVFIVPKDKFLDEMENFKDLLENKKEVEKVSVSINIFKRYEDSGISGGFEQKVECWSCGRMIPISADVCPYCKAIQKHADTDKDGMPNYWEMRYGLDPEDEADAMEDKDGDGYTNLEEYKAGSDPTNPAETPINKKKIFEVKKIYRKPVDILFRGYIELQDSFTLEINWEEKGKTFFLEVGDKIRGYEILEFHKVIQDKTIKGSGLVVEVDKSYIVLRRIGTNKKIKLVKNKIYVEREIYARIVNKETKEVFDVHVGSRFDTKVGGQKITFEVTNITIDQVFLKAVNKGNIVYHFDWR